MTAPTPQPPDPVDQECRLARLGAALDAFLDHRQAGGDDAAFLAANEELRDLLEPMLSEAQAEGAAMSGPAAGRTFGDYRLLREVGRGGAGVVYEAEQISLGRRVALKLLHGHLAISASAIERFRSEAAAVARLNHPGLVPIHEVGELGGHHFFTMEFVEGRPLNELVGADRLGVRADLSRPAECAELVARLADALQHAHERGLVHRDVKPHNVIVGAQGTVRLLDFGLARHLDPGQSSVTAEVLGTPHYMSPEQLTGVGRTGPRSDVFALGVVLYELLARQRPFDGDTARDVLRSLEQCEPAPLRRLAPRTPADLAVVCHKALEREPQARYESAGAMAADLRRFLRIEPITAQPPSLLARGGKWVRRHRVRVAIVALAATLALGAPIAWLVHQQRTRAVVEQERQRLLAADALAFRGIEGFLRLLGETVPKISSASHDAVGIEELVGLCEAYLALSEGDNERLLRVASAYHVLAGIHHQLGDLDAVLIAAERGLEVLARGERSQAELALQGRLLRQRLLVRQIVGGDDDAMFVAAVAPWQELMQHPDRDPVASTEIALTFVVRGRALIETSATRAAGEALLQRAKQLLPLAGGRPADKSLVVLRADVGLAQVAAWADRRDDALQMFAAAIELARPRAEDSRFGGELAMALAGTALVHWKQRRGDEAIAGLQDALAVLQSLTARFPAAAPLQRTRLWAATELAGMQLKRGRREAAEATLVEIVPCDGPGVQAVLTPRTWMDCSVLAGFEVQFANCCLMHGDGTERAAEARASLARAVELYERLVREQPQEEGFAVRFGGALNNLAALDNQLGEHAAAAAVARRAIALQDSVLGRDPDNRNAKTFSGMHHSQLAFGLVRLGQARDAVLAAQVGVQRAARQPGILRQCSETVALAAAAVAAEDAALATQYGDLAMQWLGRLAVGDRPAARKILADERLQFLRERTDGEQLLLQVGGR